MSSGNTHSRSKPSIKFNSNLSKLSSSCKTGIVPSVSAWYETGKKITHLWFTADDYRQEIVQYAYNMWGMDLVLVMECESWMNPLNKGDHWKAFWLCQMNSIYNDIPDMYYKDWRFQVEYCAQKRKQWTPFYWPDRIIKGKKCSQYVLDRFKLE